MSTSTFQVQGMSCEHCESAIRSEIAEVGGLEVVEVSSATGRLVVRSTRGETAEIDDQQVLAAVDEAGYEAVRA